MFEVLKGIRSFSMVRLNLFVIDKGEEDEEITLQTVFAFCKFIQHKDSRAVLLNSTRAILLLSFAHSGRMLTVLRRTYSVSGASA